jgi:AraC-like DNA-binding protein
VSKDNVIKGFSLCVLDVLMLRCENCQNFIYTFIEKQQSMVPKAIQNWLDQIKQYCPTYSKGFFRIHFKGNSPQLLFESFDRLPFVKHDKKRQLMSANTPLFDGAIYYQQLEKGCWVFYSETKYKTNICYEQLKAREPENTFYCLSLNNIEPKPIFYKEFSEKRVTFPKYSWSLQSPSDTSIIQYINLKFSGTTSMHISLYFDEHWFQQNLADSTFFIESKLGDFIKSGKGFLFTSIDEANYTKEQFKIFESLLGVGADTMATNNLLSLKLQSLNLFFNFFKHCQIAPVTIQHYAIHDDELDAVPRVEKYLVEHLSDKFPGIDMLAKKFGISETKLKNDFKLYFGKPIYQYFQEKQMQLARELLSGNDVQVKEIAYKFGYENTGKFSAAFKKFHGILPSEV